MSLDCLSGMQIVKVESYKHDGTLHRTWKESIVLDDGDPLILAKHGTEVTERDGKTWVTSELAICQFHRNRWYHTIILFKEDMNYSYYCNIASPCKMERGVLSYIDYDLDLVVDMQGNMKWLDHDEFIENKKRYSYSGEILKEIEMATAQLEALVSKRLDPFNPSFVFDWYHRFLSTQKNDETKQATCTGLYPYAGIIGRGGGENGNRR